jgi:hypothetical protein
MSQVIQQEALTRLFVEKGIFSKAEFLEMVQGVDREMGEEESRSTGRRFVVYEINIKSCFDEYSFLVSNFFLFHNPGRAFSLAWHG